MEPCESATAFLAEVAVGATFGIAEPPVGEGNTGTLSFFSHFGHLMTFPECASVTLSFTSHPGHVNRLESLTSPAQC
ncbi:MAG: hypothetical protein AAGD07_05725 [Planctomycetota bacterium]